MFDGYLPGQDGDFHGRTMLVSGINKVGPKWAQKSSCKWGYNSTYRGYKWAAIAGKAIQTAENKWATGVISPYL